MRRIIILIVIFSVTLFASDIPDIINLYSNKKSQMQRKPIIFNHGKHMKGNMGCLDCHHDYKNGQQIMTGQRLRKMDNVRCTFCHEKGKDLTDRYHKLCQSCHREYKNYNMKTGPLECGLCHKR